MTSNINRSPKDFFKLKDLDKKEDRYEENVNAILDENDLYRKKLPKGPNSLMRALSEVLFFHPHQHAEMQQSVLTLLTQLIASNKLTPRLSSFQGNSIMLKDFANNPQLTGFEKINLELIALFYNVKVILYTMNEDHYLGATIFNHNYKHTIEIFRTKASQYDALFPKSFIKKAGICQNIVLNIIDKALNGTKPNQWKNLNDDEFINITYESSLAKNQPSKDHVNIDQFRITRGNHKKSLSDNFNNNWEMMEEQQMKFYDAFLNVSNHDDFLKNFEKNRKDTAESGFSINANFDFIDDQNLDTPFQGREFAMKNYPISSKGLSPRGVSHIDMDSSPMPAFTKTKFSDHANVLFNDNLSLNEIERLEKTVNSATTIDPKQMSSPFYRNISPPGLSPTKYSQRTFTDAIQTPQSELLSSSPQINRESISPMYHYGGVNSSPAKRNIAPFMGGYQESDMYHMPNLNQRQYSDPNIQSFAPQAQMMNPQGQGFPSMQSHQYNNMGMKKMDQMGYPQNMGYGQQMGYDQGGYEQGGEYDDMMYGQAGGIREKKKPIILDEGKERYRGRLKFFDENKKYGFIIMEDDGSDIFVHYDDLCKAGIPKESLRAARSGTLIQMTFSCMAYIGKYSKSRKAVDIQLI